ncbi:MAG: helix-turn-helix domain-containing protein [Spirochaetia bacterium]|nr:helix-turn-helix domain-containing protein [Spirochaetia bacterium]
MEYPVVTPLQVRAVLKALRKMRGLTQAELGARLGVNQKRVAAIESSPGVTSFDQITRMVIAMGARLVVVDDQSEGVNQPEKKNKKSHARTAFKPTTSRDTW